MKRKIYNSISEAEIRTRMMDCLLKTPNRWGTKSELIALAKELGDSDAPKKYKDEICKFLVSKLTEETFDLFEEKLSWFGAAQKELPGIFDVSAKTIDEALTRHDIDYDKCFSFSLERVGKVYCYIYKLKTLIRLSEALEDDVKTYDERMAERRRQMKIEREKQAEIKRQEAIRIEEERKQEERAKEVMLKSMPEKMPDFYPAARGMKRRFVLHIGPTNSGKTYAAMQGINKATKGVYLGPLRLMAHEKYGELNESGIPCDMVTGEEEILTDGALFRCSTIEMADLNKRYDYVVIDEAQFIVDPHRGSGYTAAILGICADEIHVCAGPEAEVLITMLINECGDEYGVIRHDRLCPLYCESERFSFPGSVKDGDALIAFSRNAVHHIAAELQRSGIKCSIIYGNMPYDVRSEEARKFRSGETKVLGATDAIGMGLNLPIRRVVLMETSKFDGNERRILTAQEIKQIVGRAGRAGIYNEGFYTVDSSTGFSKEWLKSLVEKEVEPVSEAVIGFPVSFIGLEGKLSELLYRWKGLNLPKPYRRASCQKELMLAMYLESFSNDKNLIYDYITVPLAERYMLRLPNYLISYSNGKEFVFDIYTKIGRIKNEGDLKKMEETYRLLDFEYQICRKFGDRAVLGSIQEKKNEISKKMMGYFKTKTLRDKTCKCCGRHLPWNYRYGYCEICWKNMHSCNYRYWDDEDEY